MKDEKGIPITTAFHKILKESNHRGAKSIGRKPNKICVDKGSKFYNRSMKTWLEKNEIEMYSTHNEGKSVVAERFIRTLKMTSISKNVYIDQLDYIVNKYNNTYHRTIKMKPVDVNQTHILNLVKKLIIKILNLKLVILLEYQNIKTFLQKATFQIGLKKFL